MQFLIRWLNLRGVVVSTSLLELLKKKVLMTRVFFFCYCNLQPSLDLETREFVLSLFLGYYILGFLLDIIIFDDKPLKY